MYVRQRGLFRPETFLLGDGIIALGGSLAPVPWHIRVNLDVKDTSVLIHPRQREGLRVLERFVRTYHRSVACRGDT